MKTSFLAVSGFAAFTAATSFLSQNVAHAQTSPLRRPLDVVTMVCHESGGSGEPLTDYVNNIDVSYNLRGTLPSDLPAIYTETTPGPDGLPTSCAIASSVLSELGLKLKQSFSHFPGYYVEIFTE